MKRTHGLAFEAAAVLALLAVGVPAQAQRCPYGYGVQVMQFQNFSRQTYAPQMTMPTRMPTALATPLTRSPMLSTPLMSRPTSLATSRSLTHTLALNLNRPVTNMRTINSLSRTTEMRRTTTFNSQSR